MPNTDVLGAFVLDGVDLRVTDFGTSVTEPEDYWSRVDEFAFFDVSIGSLVPIDDDGSDALAAAAKAAQRQLYRKIAGMERRAKIDAGAYVYFTFLRPFAELAGVELDWTVPRDSLDLYPLLELIDGALPGAGRARRRPRRTTPPFRDARAPADERAARARRRSRVVGDVAARRGDDDGIGLRAARVRTDVGVAWCWTYSLRARSSTGAVVVRDHEVPLAAPGPRDPRRRAVGRATCETPFEHWTYGLEAFGVRLDDPDDVAAAARSASACRSASTSSGRSTADRRAGRRRPDASTSVGDRARRDLLGRSRSSSTRSAWSHA